MIPLPPVILHALGIAGDIASVLTYPIVFFPALAIAVAYSTAKDPPEGGLKGLWGRLAYRKIVVALLVIGAIAYALDLSDRFLFREKRYDATATMTTIHGREYRNLTVRVDGFNFIECTFENVTLIFDGQAPFQLTTAHFAPGSSIRFGSTNLAVNQALYFWDKLREQYPTIPGRFVPRDDIR
jgi:hypothetical protein